MDRDVHDIFDVILKIIVATYQSLFLKYMGVDEEIEEILSIEFTKLDGSKLYLDFLCLLKNGTLCHIEFQFPYANLMIIIGFLTIILRQRLDMVNV